MIRVRREIPMHPRTSSHHAEMTVMKFRRFLIWCSRIERRWHIYNEINLLFLPKPVIFKANCFQNYHQAELWGDLTGFDSAYLVNGGNDWVLRESDNFPIHLHLPRLHNDFRGSLWGDASCRYHLHRIAHVCERSDNFSGGQFFSKINHNAYVMTIRQACGRTCPICMFKEHTFPGECKGSKWTWEMNSLGLAGLALLRRTISCYKLTIYTCLLCLTWSANCHTEGKKYFLDEDKLLLKGRYCMHDLKGSMCLENTLCNLWGGSEAALLFSRFESFFPGT